MKLKHPILAVLILVIIAVAVFLLLKKDGNVYQTSRVERGEVMAEISVTGKVKPAKSLDMAFVQSGKISRVYVSVGDKVRVGQTLVSLDNGEFFAQLAQAEASLKIQEAKLEELKKGTRPETIQAKEAELSKTKTDLAGFYADAVDSLNDVYVKADDATTKQTDSLFTDDTTSNPKLIFIASDSQAGLDAQWQRTVAGQQLGEWQIELKQLRSDSPTAQIESALKNSQERLVAIRYFLSRLSDALRSAIGLTSTLLDTYTSAVNIGRNNINTAAADLTDKQQTIEGQKTTIEKIQAELNLLYAGALPEQIDAQAAQVEQAKANIQYARAQLEKTYLRAPFNGTVTRTVYSVGETVSADEPAVSLIGAGNFEIEANIAEADIARIKIGDSARVTLDAYGNETTFEAAVGKIDLAATTIEGMATYKTVLQFTKEDSRILAGLTANIDILADKKENVLFAPTRNIIGKNGSKTVKVLIDAEKGIIEERTVIVGLRGSDGRTEIIKGLNEGDLVL